MTITQNCICVSLILYFLFDGYCFSEQISKSDAQTFTLIEGVENPELYKLMDEEPPDDELTAKDLLIFIKEKTIPGKIPDTSQSEKIRKLLDMINQGKIDIEKASQTTSVMPPGRPWRTGGSRGYSGYDEYNFYSEETSEQTPLDYEGNIFREINRIYYPTFSDYLLTLENYFLHSTPENAQEVYRTHKKFISLYKYMYMIFKKHHTHKEIPIIITDVLMSDVYTGEEGSSSLDDDLKIDKFPLPIPIHQFLSLAQSLNIYHRSKIAFLRISARYRIEKKKQNFNRFMKSYQILTHAYELLMNKFNELKKNEENPILGTKIKAILPEMLKLAEWKFESQEIYFYEEILENLKTGNRRAIDHSYDNLQSKYQNYDKLYNLIIKAQPDNINRVELKNQQLPKKFIGFMGNVSRPSKISQVNTFLLKHDNLVQQYYKQLIKYLKSVYSYQTDHGNAAGFRIFNNYETLLKLYETLYGIYIYLYGEGVIEKQNNFPQPPDFRVVKMKPSADVQSTNKDPLQNSNLMSEIYYPRGPIPVTTVNPVHEFVVARKEYQNNLQEYNDMLHKHREDKDKALYELVKILYESLKNSHFYYKYSLDQLPDRIRREQTSLPSPEFQTLKPAGVQIPENSFEKPVVTLKEKKEEVLRVLLILRKQYYNDLYKYNFILRLYLRARKNHKDLYVFGKYLVGNMQRTQDIYFDLINVSIDHGLLDDKDNKERRLTCFIDPKIDLGPNELPTPICSFKDRLGNLSRVTTDYHDEAAITMTSPRPSPHRLWTTPTATPEVTVTRKIKDTETNITTNEENVFSASTTHKLPITKERSTTPFRTTTTKKPYEKTTIELFKTTMFSPKLLDAEITTTERTQKPDEPSEKTIAPNTQHHSPSQTTTTERAQKNGEPSEKTFAPNTQHQSPSQTTTTERAQKNGEPSEKTIALNTQHLSPPQPTTTERAQKTGEASEKTIAPNTQHHSPPQPTTTEQAQKTGEASEKTIAPNTQHHSPSQPTSTERAQNTGEPSKKTNPPYQKHESKSTTTDRAHRTDQPFEKSISPYTQHKSESSTTQRAQSKAEPFKMAALSFKRHGPQGLPEFTVKTNGTTITPTKPNEPQTIEQQKTTTTKPLQRLILLSTNRTATTTNTIITEQRSSQMTTFPPTYVTDKVKRPPKAKAYRNFPRLTQESITFFTLTSSPLTTNEPTAETRKPPTEIYTGNGTFSRNVSTSNKTDVYEPTLPKDILLEEYMEIYKIVKTEFRRLKLNYIKLVDEDCTDKSLGNNRYCRNYNRAAEMYEKLKGLYKIYKIFFTYLKITNEINDDLPSLPDFNLKNLGFIDIESINKTTLTPEVIKFIEMYNENLYQLPFDEYNFVKEVRSYNIDFKNYARVLKKYKILIDNYNKFLKLHKNMLKDKRIPKPLEAINHTLPELYVIPPQLVKFFVETHHDQSFLSNDDLNDLREYIIKFNQMNIRLMLYNEADRDYFTDKNLENFIKLLQLENDYLTLDAEQEQLYEKLKDKNYIDESRMNRRKAETRSMYLHPDLDLLSNRLKGKAYGIIPYVIEQKIYKYNDLLKQFFTVTIIFDSWTEKYENKPSEFNYFYLIDLFRQIKELGKQIKDFRRINRNIVDLPDNGIPSHDVEDIKVPWLTECFIENLQSKNYSLQFLTKQRIMKNNYKKKLNEYYLLKSEYDVAKCKKSTKQFLNDQKVDPTYLNKLNNLRYSISKKYFEAKKLLRFLLFEKLIKNTEKCTTIQTNELGILDSYGGFSSEDEISFHLKKYNKFKDLLSYYISLYLLKSKNLNKPLTNTSSEELKQILEILDSFYEEYFKLHLYLQERNVTFAFGPIIPMPHFKVVWTQTPRMDLNDFLLRPDKYEPPNLSVEYPSEDDFRNFIEYSTLVKDLLDYYILLGRLNKFAVDKGLDLVNKKPIGFVDPELIKFYTNLFYSKHIKFRDIFNRLQVILQPGKTQSMNEQQKNHQYKKADYAHTDIKSTTTRTTKKINETQNRRSNTADFFDFNRLSATVKPRPDVNTRKDLMDKPSEAIEICIGETKYPLSEPPSKAQLVILKRNFDDLSNEFYGYKTLYESFINNFKLPEISDGIVETVRQYMIKKYYRIVNIYKYLKVHNVSVEKVKKVMPRPPPSADLSSRKLPQTERDKTVEDVEKGKHRLFRIMEIHKNLSILSKLLEFNECKDNGEERIFIFRVLRKVDAARRQLI